MARIKLSDVVYTSAPKPYDSKLEPVETYDDLANVADGKTSNRWKGMTITVLNTTTTNIPCEYQLVGGRSNNCWKIKSPITVNTQNDLYNLPYSGCSVGLVAIIQDSGSLYIVDDINNDTTSPEYLKPTWVEYNAIDETQLSLELSGTTLSLKYKDAQLGDGVDMKDLNNQITIECIDNEIL